MRWLYDHHRLEPQYPWVRSSPESLQPFALQACRHPYQSRCMCRPHRSRCSQRSCWRRTNSHRHRCGTLFSTRRVTSTIGILPQATPHGRCPRRPSCCPLPRRASTPPRRRKAAAAAAPTPLPLWHPLLSTRALASKWLYDHHRRLEPQHLRGHSSHESLQPFALQARRHPHQFRCCPGSGVRSPRRMTHSFRQ